jgi:hypothetical protein
VRPGLAIALALGVWAGAAGAKLPPPTPEEQAAQQERRAQEEAQLAQQKAALEREQDRIAERYRRERGNSAPAVRGGQVSDTNMPKETRELPPAGPHGGSQQSAEAHSAPAK